MKALVTGVSGFVGVHMSDLLIQNGYEVIGLYNNNRLPRTDIKQYNCNITNYEDLKRIVWDVKPDYIFHLAGPAYVPDSYNNPKETVNVVFNGTLNVLESIRETGINTKMLYVGSSNEYGIFAEEDLPLNENCMLNPTTPYASSKASAGLLCYQYNKSFDIQVVRVRPFNHIGPGQSDKFVCSNFAKQIAVIEKSVKHGKLHIGNMNIYRDFLDVRDVVNAYLLLIKEGVCGDVYNVCSGKLTLIEDIVTNLISFSSVKNNIEVELDINRLRKNDFEKLYGDCTKLKEETNWYQRYDINDTLKDILDYWRANL